MKQNLSSLLGSMPYWVTSSFPIIRIVLVCMIAICAVIMIVTTLLQSNANDDGQSALTGSSQESYYAQNKGESRNVKLSRATIACVSIMAICIVLYFVSLIIYQG